jgi:hypothetical protein
LREQRIRLKKKPRRLLDGVFRLKPLVAFGLEALDRLGD